MNFYENLYVNYYKEGDGVNIYSMVRSPAGAKFLLQSPQTDSWAYEAFCSMAVEESFSMRETVGFRSLPLTLL
jgi:hypothetical protein